MRQGKRKKKASTERSRRVSRRPHFDRLEAFEEWVGNAVCPQSAREAFIRLSGLQGRGVA